MVDLIGCSFPEILRVGLHLCWINWKLLFIDVDLNYMTRKMQNLELF